MVLEIWGLLVISSLGLHSFKIFVASTVIMSGLNLNILMQSVESLSQQVAKSQVVNQQEKASLNKAEALLEGLKGMFGIQDILMEASGEFISIIVTINECKAQFDLDPSQQLKLCDIKITDAEGSYMDAEDILQGCAVLEQPNDIRQAMFLVSEKVSTMAQ